MIPIIRITIEELSSHLDMIATRRQDESNLYSLYSLLCRLKNSLEHEGIVIFQLSDEEEEEDKRR